MQLLTVRYRTVTDTGYWRMPLRYVQLYRYCALLLQVIYNHITSHNNFRLHFSTVLVRYRTCVRECIMTMMEKKEDHVVFIEQKAYFSLITASIAQCNWLRAKKLMDEDPYDLELGNIEGKECMSVMHILCMNTPPYDDDDWEYERNCMLQVASTIFQKSSKNVKARIYQPNLFGKSPLHLCIHGRYKNGRYEGPCIPLLELVLDHLQSIGLLQQMVCQHEIYNGGITPLHYMAEGYIPDDQIHVCEKLLLMNQPSCDTSQLLLIQDHQCRDTPLHYAAGSHSNVMTPLLRLLVQNGPQANFYYNDHGFLPMDYMIRSYVRIELDSPLLYTPTIITQIPKRTKFYYQEKNSSTSSSYCSMKEEKAYTSLTQKAEQSILKYLWPQLKIMVQSAALYQIRLCRSDIMEDVKDLTLVHLAATCPTFPVIILICALNENPNAIQQPTNIHGTLPLHMALSSSSFYRHNGTIKSSTMVENDEIYLSRWNVTENSKMKMPKSNYSMVEYLIEQYPDSVHVWTKQNNQLAIHLACSNGASWYDISLLLKESPKSISCPDGPTKLYPFMLAAIHQNNTLDVVFQLLLFDPEIIRHHKL